MIFQCHCRKKEAAQSWGRTNKGWAERETPRFVVMEEKNWILFLSGAWGHVERVRNIEDLVLRCKIERSQLLSAEQWSGSRKVWWRNEGSSRGLKFVARPALPTTFCGPS